MEVKVTIVTTVYNCQKYLTKSIGSILNQTFKDFEYIIVNDGSTDGTWEIASAFASKDKRIILINNKANLGRPKSLNIALEKAKGKYIAVQDADDISSHERIEKQFTFLENNPDYVLVGSNVTVIDENENLISAPLRPVDNLDAKFSLLFRCTFANPSIMYRRRVVSDNSLKYEENFVVADDFRIITLISRHGKIFNLNETLVKYRRHGKNLSSVKYEDLKNESIFVVKENLAYLGLEMSDEQICRIRNLVSARGINQKFLYTDVKSIFQIIRVFQNKYGNTKNREILKLLIRMKNWLGRKNLILRPKYFYLYIEILMFHLKESYGK